MTHAGAGAAAKSFDGPDAAARAAFDILRAGGDALVAVVAATVALEDDPRFNAGTGSNLRLDGVTCEMDAAVATSDGRSGAVACIEGVRNPVRVARHVLDLPHTLIAGAGATALARRLGFTEYDPVTPRARKRWQRTRRRLERLAAGEQFPDRPRLEVWRGIELAAFWNFPAELAGCDTVGAVARDGTGAFAAACSTGGTAIMLRGRVGDSPLYGSGLFAGSAGAVTATGMGEEIVQRSLSRSVYDRIAAGIEPEVACRDAVDAVPHELSVGVLAVTATGHGYACNRSMPVAVETG